MNAGKAGQLSQERHEWCLTREGALPRFSVKKKKKKKRLSVTLVSVPFGRLRNLNKVQMEQPWKENFALFRSSGNWLPGPSRPALGGHKRWLRRRWCWFWRC